LSEADGGQQLITEYPTVEDYDEPEPDLDGYGIVRFDLEADDGSIDRAREQQADIEIVTDGYHVSLEDGDHDHLVVLSLDEDGWQADCWNLNADGERTGRCRGWVHHDGPCAHLWAARSHIAQQRLEDDDARHDQHVERAIADGGHHRAEEGQRR
jgi:hypothetical protein